MKVEFTGSVPTPDQIATLEKRMLAGLGTDETSQLRHSLHARHANLSSDAGQTTI
jgi:hypothetical protein